MDTRDRLMGLISGGINATQISDNSNKSILIRGCDPEMGRRAIELLTPVLGNPEMVSVTNDDDFITELQKKSGQLFILHQAHVGTIQQNHPFQVVVHKRKVGVLENTGP